MYALHHRYEQKKKKQVRVTYNFYKQHILRNNSHDVEVTVLSGQDK